MCLDHNPLPPPPFSSRQMLPPSSPKHAQSQYNIHPTAPRAPPPPPPFSNNRDLPALSSTYRPGSSMSISSMLGSDSDKPSRESNIVNNGAMKSTTPASPLPAAPSPTAHTRLVQSPRRDNGSESFIHKSQLLDERHSSLEHANRSHRNYLGETPPSPFSGAKRSSPEALRFSSSLRPSAAAHDQSVSQFSRSPETESGKWRAPQDRRQSIDSVMRPYRNRATGFATPPLEAKDTVRISTPNTQNPPLSTGSREPEGGYNGDREADHATSSRREDRPYTPQTHDDRMGHFIDVGRAHNSSTFHSLEKHRTNGTVGSNYPFLSRLPQSTSSPNPKSRITADVLGHRTPDLGSEVHSNSSHSPGMRDVFRLGRGSQPMGRHLSHDVPLRSPSQGRSHFADPADNRQTQNPRSNALNSETLRSEERNHQGKSFEDGQHQQKNYSGLLVENIKRGGRWSPLPQAVQGAQGQMRGPASEPGIKNEFARMFSGIGSGVGSIGTPPVGPIESGAPTSFPLTPFREDEVRRSPFASRGESMDSNKVRAAPKRNRRSGKIKYEDSKLDTESCDGQAFTGLIRARGTKRTRHGHHHQ